MPQKKLSLVEIGCGKYISNIGEKSSRRFSGSRMANGDSYSDFVRQRTLVPCDSKLLAVLQYTSQYSFGWDFVTLLLCSCCFVDLCIMWYQVQYRFQLFIRKRNPPVGASVHCTDVNMRYLDNQFGDRVINRRCISQPQELYLPQLFSTKLSFFLGTL